MLVHGKKIAVLLIAFHVICEGMRRHFDKVLVKVLSRMGAADNNCFRS